MSTINPSQGGNEWSPVEDSNWEDKGLEEHGVGENLQGAAKASHEKAMNILADPDTARGFTETHQQIGQGMSSHKTERFAEKRSTTRSVLADSPGKQAKAVKRLKTGLTKKAQEMAEDDKSFPKIREEIKKSVTEDFKKRHPERDISKGKADTLIENRTKALVGELSRRKGGFREALKNHNDSLWAASGDPNWTPRATKACNIFKAKMSTGFHKLTVDKWIFEYEQDGGNLKTHANISRDYDEIVKVMKEDDTCSANDVLKGGNIGKEDEAYESLLAAVKKDMSNGEGDYYYPAEGSAQEAYRDTFAEELANELWNNWE